MRLIKPTYEILTDIRNTEFTKQIERIARVCYKSEDLIQEGSDLKMIATLLKNKHEAMIEHAPVISVLFHGNRGFSHEIVRMRLASFAQECVTGNTKISMSDGTKITIEELHELQEKGESLPLAKSVTNDQLIVANKIMHVFKKKGGDVYRANTEEGYSLDCSCEHKLLRNSNEYDSVKNLKVGEYINVNGRPSLLNIDEDSLVEEYKDLSPLEISEKHKIPYRSIIRILKKLNVFTPRKNDKNPGKYNINHTEDSYKKMKETIDNQYKNGRVVWNRGVKESENKSVAKQAETLRNHHHNNGKGEENSAWLGNSVKNGYSRANRNFSLKEVVCLNCGSTAKERHHSDKDTKNNEEYNLLPLCVKCHKLIHKEMKKCSYTKLSRITSIEKIGVEEFFYDLEMNSPLNNYVAEGFITHNSTRYVNYSKEKFGNEISVIIPDYIENLGQEAKDIFLSSWESSQNNYMKLIGMGVKAQVARDVLPIGIKADIVVTTNIREWRHIMDLRTADVAHPIMHELMRPLLKEFQESIPLLFDDIEY